jgi:hypothetical protein
MMDQPAATSEWVAYAAGLLKGASQVRLYGPAFEGCAMELEAIAASVLRGLRAEMVAEDIHRAVGKR